MSLPFFKSAGADFYSFLLTSHAIRFRLAAVSGGTTNSGPGHDSSTKKNNLKATVSQDNLLYLFLIFS